jgi:hypothetical protein
VLYTLWELAEGLYSRVAAVGRAVLPAAPIQEPVSYRTQSDGGGPVMLDSYMAVSPPPGSATQPISRATAHTIALEAVYVQAAQPGRTKPHRP